ncbi:MAG: hypothetical protein IPO68_06355, partial [Chitinophagaceae bacterium]|nr:hypothetical protein [Chitinophagaceae bacterium]
HAPYSISPETFQLINEATSGQVISIRNQEHPAEDELYKNRQGRYLRPSKYLELITSGNREKKHPFWSTIF